MNLSAFALGNCAYNDTCLIFWSAEWAPPTAIAALKDAESSMRMPCLATIIQPHILHTRQTVAWMVHTTQNREVNMPTVVKYGGALW